MAKIHVLASGYTRDWRRQSLPENNFAFGCCLFKHIRRSDLNAALAHCRDLTQIDIWAAALATLPAQPGVILRAGNGRVGRLQHVLWRR